MNEIINLPTLEMNTHLLDAARIVWMGSIAEQKWHSARHLDRLLDMRNEIMSKPLVAPRVIHRLAELEDADRV